MQQDVPVIRVDAKNTVHSLKAQLLNLTASGADDSGFPILQQDVNHDGMRMVGYIGSNELDHALSTYDSLNYTPSALIFASIGLVPADADDDIHFHTAFSHQWASSSFSSLQEAGQPLLPSDPFDFTPYMDQVCQNHSNECRALMIIGPTYYGKQLSHATCSPSLCQAWCKIYCDN